MAVLISGSLLFAAGTLLFAVVVRSPATGRSRAVLTASALVVFGVSRLVPIVAEIAARRGAA